MRNNAARAACGSVGRDDDRDRTLHDQRGRDDGQVVADRAEEDRVESARV